MSISLPTLLERIERGSEDTGNRRGSRIVVGLAVALGVLMVIGAILAGDAFVLWQGWQTANWSNFQTGSLQNICFSAGVFFSIPLVFVMWRASPLAKPNELMRSANMLRELAAADDEQVAPRVAPQPAPLGAGEFSGEPLRIGPLKRPVTMRGGAAVILTGLPILVAMVLVFELISLMGEPGLPGDFFSSTLFPLVFVPLFAVVFAPTIIGASLMARARRFSVTADAQGIRWRRQGRESARDACIPWTEVRALARIVSSPVAGQAAGISYLLTGADVSLIWIVASQASAAERAASEALLRLAVTSTGKPLRDCSIAAKELAQTGSQGSPVWGSSALAGQATAPASLADLSRLMREGQKPRRRRVWLVIAPALVFFLALSALPYAGSAWLQGYQTQYLTSLPARLHAEQPFYTDSLSWNDGDWPMSTPSETSCGAGYQQGANYQLSGQVTGDTCTADTEPVYGDAAVEVTALESGKLGPKLSDGVGLVLRASEDGMDFVAFYVLASGEWDLFHSEYLDGTYTSGWPILASGTSGAIHTGFGATNRLLVLMRGNLFLLYVNDQLVGTYYARYDHLPASGHVGVYLNESSITGSFTDFAVYPVQPPSSFWYI